MKSVKFGNQKGSKPLSVKPKSISTRSKSPPVKLQDNQKVEEKRIHPGTVITGCFKDLFIVCYNLLLLWLCF